MTSINDDNIFLLSDYLKEKKINHGQLLKKVLAGDILPSLLIIEHQEQISDFFLNNKAAKLFNSLLSNKNNSISVKIEEYEHSSPGINLHGQWGEKNAKSIQKRYTFHFTKFLLPLSYSDLTKILINQNRFSINYNIENDVNIELKLQISSPCLYTYIQEKKDLTTISNKKEHIEIFLKNNFAIVFFNNSSLTHGNERYTALNSKRKDFILALAQLHKDYGKDKSFSIGEIKQYINKEVQNKDTIKRYFDKKKNIPQFIQQIKGKSTRNYKYKLISPKRK